MFQMITFDHPIPSCEIYSISYDQENKKWSFTYALNTPVELKDDEDVDLIIYEYICDLILKDPKSLHPESINIHVKNLREYRQWLERQREEDIKFRKKFLENNPDAVKNLITHKLENKDYSYQELSQLGLSYFSFIQQQDDHETVFAAV